MSLIVNADDFGLSQEVNRAIVEAFSKNLINRTTLMVNMPYAEEAMELARANGFVDKVGVHINLTAGHPVSDKIAKNRVMCDTNGEYTADFARSLKTRFFLDKQTTKDISEELICQLERYKELGGCLWHIDSHHHVHTDPSVWKVISRIIKKYPISSVRLGRNMYRGGNPLMHMYKTIYNASVRRFCAVRPDLFGSARDYNDWFKGKNEEYIEDFVKNHNVEVMVHPVYNDSLELTDSLEPFYELLK